MVSGTTPRLVEQVSSRDHVSGGVDAPLTIVEYGDYQCPHCRIVHQNIKQLRERLGDQLQYVYRHLPITTVHPEAQLAAEAAEAAAAQGKFWEMHDLLFSRQQLSKRHLLGYAAELDLDMERFEQDLDENVYAKRVQADFRNGLKSGVNGTPTFFVNGQRYDGAWDLESLLELIEKPLGIRAQLLTQRFTQLAASGGIVLLVCTLIAIIWANSPWAENYFHFWELPLSFNFSEWNLSEHLLEWVNDGLMVIFFFVVGLEIKREVISGELASPRQAALPIAAAIGGMVVPALFYVAANAGGPGIPGWGVPMATDIAFTLGILTVLGNRVPLSLKVFFTALAIADDLGAILVIALFYTADISWLALGFAALFLAGLIALNRARIYSPRPYALLGVGLWLAFLESGIHPTIAGVLLALTIPTRSPANLRALLAQTVTLLNSFELPLAWRETIDSRRQATVSMLDTIINRMLSPAERLEHQLTPWSTYLILPIFALANAGVALSGDALANLTDPVSLGIILGLVVGKPLGISFFSWLAIRLDWAEMPDGVQWPQFISASFLAGIGFTMSLFISGAAFTDPALLDTAKLAILVASVVAALLGWGLLTLSSTPQEGNTQIELVVVNPGD